MSARQFTINSTSQVLNGAPNFLGVLTAGAVTGVDNSTTAVPFQQTPIGPTVSSIQPTINYSGTLAGRTLLIQPLAQGLILPSSTAGVITIVPQTTTPVFTTPQSIPGVLLAANERVVLIMGRSQGWLQWLSSSGTASCLVWELL